MLSLEEADKYFGDSGDYRNGDKKDDWYFSNEHDNDRRATYNGSSAWWWLRSPGDFSFSAAHVYPDGVVHVSGVNVGIDYGGGGVRPALWLNLGS